MGAAGRALVVLGLLLAAAGGVLVLLNRLIGQGAAWRLPGDLVWRSRGFTLILPLGTSLALSAFLTVLLWLLSRAGR